MPEPLRFLSPTKLRAYHTCPLQYRHRYLDRRPSPYTPASLRGQAVHEVLEANFEQKKHARHDLELDAALDLYEDVWDRLAPGEFREEAAGDSAAPWRAEHDAGAAVLELYLATAAPSIVPHLVEHRFRFDVPGVPVPVVGTVDLIDRNGVVIDHKTSREPYDPGYPSGDLQLLCYAIAYATVRAGARQRPGELPSAYFVPPVRVDVLVASDPPSIQQLGATYTADDLQEFVAASVGAAQGIEAEQFEPFWRQAGATRDVTVCGRCPYSPVCDESLLPPEPLLEADGDDRDEEE